MQQSLLKVNTQTSLEPQRIVYLQSEANSTYVHTYGKQFLSSRTLKVFSAHINNNIFVIIRQGLLVNSLYIANLNDDKLDHFIELICGKKLLVSLRIFSG